MIYALKISSCSRPPARRHSLSCKLSDSASIRVPHSPPNSSPSYALLTRLLARSLARVIFPSYSLPHSPLRRFLIRIENSTLSGSGAFLPPCPIAASAMTIAPRSVVVARVAIFSLDNFPAGPSPVREARLHFRDLSSGIVSNVRRRLFIELGRIIVLHSICALGPGLRLSVPGPRFHFSA